MATNTANYNLVKPAGKEKVSIETLNSNMDVIDAAMKGLDDRTVTVANNLTTDEEGHALDAVQGKVLADRVSEVNSVLSKEATQSLKGLMSVTDKMKLDGIEEGAIKYIHPTNSGNKHLPIGGVEGQILQNTEDGTATWQDLVAEGTGISTANQILYDCVSNVDDALQRAYNGDNNVLVVFDLCYPNTTVPVTGTYTFTISGTNINSSISFTTNGAKKKIGILLPVGSYTVASSTLSLPFLSTSQSLTLVISQHLRNMSLFRYDTSVRFYSTSGILAIDQVAVSHMSSIDVCLIGGGGSGGGNNSGGDVGGGGGGGGGYMTTQNLPPSAFDGVSSINVTIGAGGAGGSTGAGNAGGTTSVVIGSATKSAAGGQGSGAINGAIGGRGGNGGGGGGGGGYAKSALTYTYGGTGGQNGGNGVSGGSGQGGSGGAGSGIITTVFGGSTYYCAGGGGGTTWDSAYTVGSPGGGGTHGGGRGGAGNGASGSPGTVYGAGGGGGSGPSGGAKGGAGYQGAFVMRFNL